LKDDLVKGVDYGRKLGADYVEVRGQRLFKTFLTTKDGRVEAAKEGTENGAGVRVLAKGAWGFVSLGKLDSKLLTEAVGEAFKLAEAASFKVKTPVKLVETKALEDRVVAKSRKDPREVPIEEKIDVALTMDKTIFNYDRRMKSCTIDYLDVTGTNYFINSDRRNELLH
jgi:TldD protein